MITMLRSPLVSIYILHSLCSSCRDLERYKELEQRIKNRLKSGHDQQGFGDLVELVKDNANQHALATPTLGRRTLDSSISRRSSLRTFSSCDV